MSEPTVGIMSPGDFGNALGAHLHQRGLRILCALDGRSERTASLAQKAGLEDVDTPDELVAQADIILSIVPPGAAEAVANRVAEALRHTDHNLIFADLNAISPRTSRRLADTIKSAGGTYVDAAILGPPLRAGATTRFFVSGPDSSKLSFLADSGLSVEIVSEEIGAASALKACYAGLTKALTAMATLQFLAAERFGLLERLLSQLSDLEPQLFDFLEKWVPRVPPRAGRWSTEMDQIADTHEELDHTARFHEGAAHLFRRIAATPPGRIAPEDYTPLGLKELFEQLTTHLDHA